MALPTAAPTMAPPRMPAPTAQPKQRASAVEGAMNAEAMTAAAAKVVKVLVIQSPPDGLERDEPSAPSGARMGQFLVGDFAQFVASPRPSIGRIDPVRNLMHLN